MLAFPFVSLRRGHLGGRVAGLEVGRVVAVEDVLARLRAQPEGALFVTELAARLALGPGRRDELERALGDLESGRAILIAEHAVPDPHLASADLRVVALVPTDVAPAVAEQRALAASEEAWNAWLQEFLGSHRCD